MRIGLLITARLKSSRLELKLLKKLNGRTVIDRVIERATDVAECDEVVLCTSANNQDLPLVRLARANNIYYFCGESDDVLQRLLDAAVLFNLDYIIGVTADNPLFSIYYANVISDRVRRDPSVDFLYTVGHPIGMNMYALRTKALKVVCAIKEEIDTEIWGRLFNRPEIFNVLEIPVEEKLKVKADRITLDEYHDYVLLKKIFDSFPENYVIEEDDLNFLFETEPSLLSINSHVIQRDLSQETIDRIDAYYVQNKQMIIDKKNELYGQQ